MKTLRNLTLLLIAGSLTMTSCKKEDEDGNTPKTMSVRMTDSPGDYEKLEVEIASVEAYNSSEGWITLNSESQIVSVLDLTNGNEVTIVSETKVKSGAYSKLRLTFGSKNKLWVNTQASLGTPFLTAEFDLSFTTPQKQVEVVIQEDISNKDGANILIDFNVAESITGTVTSGFALSPKITVIKDEKTGARGTVNGTANAAIQFTNSANTYSTYTDANGHYLIRGMVAGGYDVTVTPTEDDASSIEIQNVNIVEGEIRQMSDISVQ